MGGGPGGRAPLLLALATVTITVVCPRWRRPRATALLLFLVLLLELMAVGQAVAAEDARHHQEMRRWPTRPRPHRQLFSDWGPGPGPRRLEVVEGCFNRFDAMLEVPVDPGAIVGHFNNRRCQAACGERGYALAATRSSPQACLCGNDYPSPFHQFDAGRCDAPCNPDHESCLLFTCCGDRNGTLFTVSFARQRSVVRQVLQQMAFDYRNSSPTFRGKIEGALVDASPLRVIGDDDEGPSWFLVAPGAAEAVAAAAGAEEGCGGSERDGGWVSFEGACYKLHWAQPVAQDEAQRRCLGDDGAGTSSSSSSLVVPESATQNAFVARLQAGCQGWLGLRLEQQGEWKPYHNWTGDGGGLGRSDDDDEGQACVQMRPDGAWVRAPCRGDSTPLGHVRHHRRRDPGPGNADCFVCQKGQPMVYRAAAEEPVVPSARDTDSWRMVECPQQREEEEKGDGMVVRLQHEASGRSLGCSHESGRLVLLQAGGGERDGARSTFVARVDEAGSGGFTLTQGSLVVAWADDHRSGDGSGRRRRIVCRPAAGAGATPTAVRFESTCMLRVLARRYLRLSVVVLSNDLNIRGWRDCSVAAYDTSPSSASYRCRPLPDAAARADEMWLEQQALLVTDWQRWLLPRYPLPLGRVRCANEHPRQSAICTLAYGRGVTMARAVTIDWGSLIFNTITTRCNVQAALGATFRLPGTGGTGAGGADGGGGDGDGGGGGGGDGGDDGSSYRFALQATALKELSNDFTVAFNHFYERAVVRAYVETRNWQTSIRTRPLSTVTAQLWLEQVQLTYRWRALFQARGSFRVLYFDRPVGGRHAIGDVLEYDDVFFFVFGRYDVPVEASIILTIDDRDESRWPLDIPGSSVVEEPFFPTPPRRA